MSQIIITLGELDSQVQSVEFKLDRLAQDVIVTDVHTVTEELIQSKKLLDEYLGDVITWFKELSTLLRHHMTDEEHLRAVAAEHLQSPEEAYYWDTKRYWWEDHPGQRHPDQDNYEEIVQDRMRSILTDVDNSAWMLSDSDYARINTYRRQML